MARRRGHARRSRRCSGRRPEGPGADSAEKWTPWSGLGVCWSSSPAPTSCASPSGFSALAGGTAAAGARSGRVAPGSMAAAHETSAPAEQTNGCDDKPWTAFLNAPARTCLRVRCLDGPSLSAPLAGRAKATSASATRSCHLPLSQRSSRWRTAAHGCWPVGTGARRSLGHDSARIPYCMSPSRAPASVVASRARNLGLRLLGMCLRVCGGRARTRSAKSAGKMGALPLALLSAGGRPVGAYAGGGTPRGSATAGPSSPGMQSSGRPGRTDPRAPHCLHEFDEWSRNAPQPGESQMPRSRSSNCWQSRTPRASPGCAVTRWRI